MVGIDFPELALIFGVTLIVLGPKRMSELATKVGRWVGKARTMARDFRQQLENEVNLDELNKMTELQTRQARDNPVPAPPPEFSGAPLPDPASPPTYPYSAPEPAPEPALEAASETPQTDDTYSHAHAEGEAPIPYEPEPLTEAAVPAQADLDLSIPDESHLPPDDARRTT